MPPLSALALRYLVWLIGLRVLYALGVTFLSLPQSMATDVILAAVPLVDIGTHVARRANRPLVIGDWVVVWGLCLGIFGTLMVLGPLVIGVVAGVDVTSPEILQANLTAVSATGVMMALFLLVGARIRG